MLFVIAAKRSNTVAALSMFPDLVFDFEEGEYILHKIRSRSISYCSDRGRNQAMHLPPGVSDGDIVLFDRREESIRRRCMRCFPYRVVRDYWRFSQDTRRKPCRRRNASSRRLLNRGEEESRDASTAGSHAVSRDRVVQVVGKNNSKCLYGSYTVADARKPSILGSMSADGNM